MEQQQLHKEIIERLVRIETVSEGILVEAKRTNGRVSTLERNHSQMENELALVVDREKAQMVILNDNKTWKDKLIHRSFDFVLWIMAMLMFTVLVKTGVLNL